MIMPTKKTDPLWRIGIEYAPLLIFLAVNFLMPNALAMIIVARNTGFLSGMDQLSAVVVARVIVATTVFMVATVAAIIVSRLRFGHVSPMLWITGALVVVFGGLTLYFRDPQFIQMKPTFVYLVFAAILAFGIFTGRPLLQMLLQAAYPGLDDVGWRKLTINWAIFFLAMAIMNEVVWRASAVYLSKGMAWNVWTLYKFPGCVIVTLLFAFANIPMLMKHGLQMGEKPPVPPQE